MKLLALGNQSVPAHRQDDDFIITGDPSSPEDANFDRQATAAVPTFRAGGLLGGWLSFFHHICYIALECHETCAKLHYI